MATCPHCGTENPGAAAFCMTCGAALDVPLDAAEVRKTVTVVFCDVVGSTHLGEQLDPETLRQVMIRYFDAMRHSLERHGGTVEKFIGDAVMAVFGVPHVHEDDALRAVRAAVQMRDEVVALSKELERDQGVQLSARIGVNTGEVVAGSASTRQAIVTGDVINVAARLEQVAKPGTVLIGPSTHRLVRDYVEASPVGPLSVKGKTQEIEAHCVRQVADERTQRPRRAGAPLVGRRRELEAMRAAFDRAVSDRMCQSFTILAPAGTGKSRLVEEFLQDLREVQSLQGRCPPYGEGITYFPIVQVVKQAAGLADFDATGSVAVKIRDLLDDDDQADVVSGRVSQLLGVGSPGSTQDTLWAVRRFLEAVARRTPLVLVLDDVHWAEPTLLDLLEHVAEWSRDVPLLLLCMARPELLDVRPAWGAGRLNAATITLEPLSEDECGQLIGHVLGSTGVPETVRSRVTDAAGGTPLFVEEMLTMLVDEGLLHRSAGEWVAAAHLDAVGLPPTISALLEARLDRLSTEERQVLEVAAVMGEEFLVGGVLELVDETLRESASSRLMNLVRKALIRPHRSTLPGEDAFRFRHLLIRDAAYEALPKQRRAELHAQVADWLERVAGQRVAEQEEIVGYHLEQAHRYRVELGPLDPSATELALRAGHALGASGRRAFARDDMRAAANLLGRAVTLFPKADPDRLALLPDLSGALLEVGKERQARRLLDEGLALAGPLDDRRLLANLLVAQAELAEEGPDWEHRVSTPVTRALGLLDHTGDTAGQAKGHRVLGFVAWVAGDVGDAIARWRLSASLAAAAGQESSAAHDHAWILVARFFDDTPATDLLRLAHEAMLAVTDHPAARAEMMWTLSGAHAMLGQFEEASRVAAESTQIHQALGRDLSASHFGAQVEEFVHLMRGDHKGRVDVLRRELTTYRGLADEDNPLLRGMLAQALSAAGDDDDAWETAEAALALGGDSLWVRTHALQAEALVLGRRSEHELALALAQEVLGGVSPTGNYWMTAEALMTLGEVHRLAGRLGPAAEAIASAVERFAHKEMHPLVQRGNGMLDEIRGEAPPADS